MAPRLAFLASDRPEANAAREALAARYGEVPEEAADVVVALGGDGFMLETLHRNLPSRRPIYGMNRGSVGFLMNDYDEAGLLERIAAAEQAVIHPLLMHARDAAGAEHAGARDQRGLAAAPDLPDRQAAHPDRRQGAHGRADLRRRPGLDPGRLDRLQSLRPRPDHPAVAARCWR